MRRRPSPGRRDMPAARPVRNRTLLLYAQDNQGLGHVTRTLTLARHVLARHPDCIAYIATKSPLAGFTLPERCDYIKLPTLLTAGTVRPTAAEEEAAKQHFRTIRGAILRDAVLGPRLILVWCAGAWDCHRTPHSCSLRWGVAATGIRCWPPHGKPWSGCRRRFPSCTRSW